MKSSDTQVRPASGNILVHLLWLVPTLYLLPLLAIFVDECVLHTMWFSGHLPGWIGPVFRTLYPFYLVLAYF